MNDKKVRNLILPNKLYGSFCLKILNDFINHHNLPKDLSLPSDNISIQTALSMIFDIMIYSMGEKKRNEILDDLDKYKMSMPANLR